MLYPQFLDHLVFRVSDLSRTEQFYSALLGAPRRRTSDSIMYQIRDTRLFFTSRDEPQKIPYDKEAVGLNHLAFGIRTAEDLIAIGSQLDAAGIPHSGIRKDRYGDKDFIWLDDPDGMRLEFYLRPS